MRYVVLASVLAGFCCVGGFLLPGIIATRIPSPAGPFPVETGLPTPHHDPDDEGTLQLEIKGVGSPGPSGWWENLELFVDDRPKQELGNPFSAVQTLKLRLPPGEHSILLQKNGIEVYRGKVEVKKPSEETTFASVPLEVTGTVVITNPVPVAVGVVAFVRVDGQKVKDWPVGTTSIEVPAEVGSRVIEVVVTQPVSKTIAKFDAQIEPDKKFVYNIRP